MAPAPDLGDLVYVDEACHPAFLVTSKRPRVKNGTTEHYIQWQHQGHRQWVKARRIKEKLKGRSRKTVLPPVRSPTSSQTADPKKKNASNEEKRTSKSPKRRAETEDTEAVSACEPDLGTVHKAKKAKRPKRRHADPTNDDAVQLGDDFYTITGFTSIYHPCDQFPDMLQVEHDHHGECLYVRVDPNHPQEEGRVNGSGAVNHGIPSAANTDNNSQGAATTTARIPTAKKNQATHSKKGITTPNNNKNVTEVRDHGHSQKTITSYADQLLKTTREKAVIKRGLKREKRPYRLADHGDVVPYQGRLHHVVGVSRFFHRFKYLEDQLQLQDDVTGRNVFVPRETFKIKRRDNIISLSHMA